VRRGVALGICAGAVVLGTLLRVHFLHAPLVSDEGGYATVARLWGSGYRLYGDVAWVDRPQGLLVLYRVAGLAGTAEAFRVLAMIAAAVTTAGVAAFAWALAGRRAGALAALAYAVVSPSPHLEGYTANGELLAGAFATTACAAAAWWLTARRPWLLVLAGLTAGAAPLVKQSAFDGLVVVAAAILLAGSPRGRNIALAVAGAVIAPAAAVIHAALTGFHAWWWAIVGYRSTTESLWSGDVGARLRLLADSVVPVLQDLPLLLALAVAGVVVARRERFLALPCTWIAAGFLGLLGGGLYHPHYWVQLIPPLAVLGGIGADRLAAHPRWLAGVVAGAVALTLVWSVEPYTTTPSARAPDVGRALGAETRPGDPVYVIWGNADAYWYADRPPAFRYLWVLNVQRIPGALGQVRSIFTGPHPPRAVAALLDPGQLDTTGTIARALHTRYRELAPVDGARMYVLRQ
jgi:4-amino-4-deoxy-L-arabinose transferase-like glycosyltransferase